MNGVAEEKRQPVGIDTPHQSLDAERSPFGRNQLQLHRRSGLQSRVGSYLRSIRADVDGSRQVPACAGLDDDRPGLADSRVPASILSRAKGHEWSRTW